MKFQKTPLILLFSALLLGGYVYFSELRKEPQPQTTQTEAKPIFAFKEDEVQAFTVKTAQQTLSFEQIPMSIPAGQKGLGKTSSWQMIAPEKTTADQATVAFLLNLIATAKSDRTLLTPITRQAEFGLNPPIATIEVKLGNQQTHRLLLGKPNFNRQFLYALADPIANSSQDLAVLQVPINFQNAIDRPLSEWKQANPTPKASSTPSSPNTNNATSKGAQ
ncbi:DUF4340 domain-containing protein [Phormidesmis priestleyi ULC007]|uniref:DUF4340 domain-containing protein n=1 Tax=Phormidesmis priestleyi ULC007 TaxID=1920490 RepID=A0A2T1D8R1_9CYAN|nr:DUF4340 domain-containing protein [Phormidesmis priestleyi]PSB16841.1 DUF4340 domain-containing protein [Phormidesmis priestleyi ULC007]PZO47756.1 MAG: DUF4340 domain-containing protein [Phormidesmis priestleyi]